MKRALILAALLLVTISFSSAFIDTNYRTECQGDDLYYCNSLTDCTKLMTCSNGCEELSPTQAQCETGTAEPEDEPATGSCSDFQTTTTCEGEGCFGPGQFVYTSINGPLVVEQGATASYDAYYEWEETGEPESGSDTEDLEKTPDSHGLYFIEYKIQVHDGQDTTTCATGYTGSGQADLSCTQSVNGQIAVATTITDGTNTATRCIETNNQLTCDDVGEGADCGSGIGDGFSLHCTEQEVCCPYGEEIIDGTCQEPSLTCEDELEAGEICCDGEPYEGSSCPEKKEGTQTTNALVLETDGEANIHLCGTHWDLESPVVEQHEVCTQLESSFGRRYQCAVNETGWVWTLTHHYRQSTETWDSLAGLAQMPADNDALWSNLTIGLNRSESLSDDLLEQPGLACDGATPVTAVSKQDADSTEQGVCAPSQCYADGQCFEQSTMRNNSICTQEDARWQGATVALANEMLATVTGEDVLINCGSQATVTNFQTPEAIGYCELAVVKGGTLTAQYIDEIQVGAVYEQEINETFFAEVKKVHPDFNQTTPAAYMRNGTHPAHPGLFYAHFTSAQEFDVDTTTLWERVKSTFGFEDPADLPTTIDGYEFYLSTAADAYAATQYVPDVEDCPEELAIVDADGTATCWNAHHWREVIRQR